VTETVLDQFRAAADMILNQVISGLSAEGVETDEYELLAMAKESISQHIDRESNRIGTLPEVLTLLEFIGTAIAGGIIGNVAYDALKGVLRRLSSRRHSGPVTEKLEEVVVFAVAEQCRRFQLQVDPSKPRLRQWELGSTYAVAKVDAEGSELTAEVTVPYDSWLRSV
jgi:hypothetical protein